MKFIDSHAHLDFEHFDSDFEDVLARAENVGVEKIINIGADVDRSKASVILAEAHDSIYATAGIHPEEAGDSGLGEQIEDIERVIKSSRRVVGVGECGLDYYRITKKEDKEKQIALFEAQIELAQRHHLPLVIHIRNGEGNSAYKDAIESLLKYKVDRGVVHCFTFGPCEAKELLSLGLHIGFTGIITYKNSIDICEAARVVPMDKILVETDCPFLAPKQYRGKRNEPAYVTEIAVKIAEIKGLTVEKIATTTARNTEKLFNI